MEGFKDDGDMRFIKLISLYRSIHNITFATYIFLHHIMIALWVCFVYVIIALPLPCSFKIFTLGLIQNTCYRNRSVMIEIKSQTQIYCAARFWNKRHFFNLVLKAYSQTTLNLTCFRIAKPYSMSMECWWPCMCGFLKLLAIRSM